MSEQVKISAFEVENVKRVKAVSYEINGESLTIIGGDNAQGKTSVLDAIMWTLGGDRYKPSQPLRDGAEKLATKITLNNGIIVERKGVSGALKITSPNKSSGGQQILNEFISSFALDLPKFMQATAKEKAQMLLDQYPELGPRLNRLNLEAKRIYDERHAQGVIVERKKKYAQELPYNTDAPLEPLTGSEMTQRLQDMLRVNAENDRLRREVQSVRIAQQSAANRVKELERQLAEAVATLGDLDAKMARAERAASTVKDEDTTSIQRELENIDAINSRVRQNLDKARAEAESEALAETYRELSASLEQVRTDRIKLLSEVQMPLEGITIDESGDLLYRLRPWDGMSGMEQMRVATAICASINPKCGFVLLDGLERMDTAQLEAFSTWLAERNLQAIGTRVSRGDECSIIIEDGVGHQVEASAEPEYKFT